MEEDSPNEKTINETKTKPGIVYLSRICPGLNPASVRSLLEKYGEIGRIYLQPESNENYLRRKSKSGKTRKLFTEGWVEFLDKKVAKSAAQFLNNSRIGFKKSQRFYDDLWNMKYLSKFKWTNITEKQAYEKAIKEKRIKSEIAQAKREVSFYLSNVERSNILNAVAQRNSKKANSASTSGLSSKNELDQIREKFRQRSARVNTTSLSNEASTSSMLRKVF